MRRKLLSRSQIGPPKLSQFAKIKPIQWCGSSGGGPDLARVLAELRSGDGPLSVRARPSSIKHDCDRRTTSTSGKCLVNAHAKSRLTLDSTDTPVAGGQRWNVGPAHGRRKTVLDDLPQPTDLMVEGGRQEGRARGSAQASGH